MAPVHNFENPPLPNRRRVASHCTMADHRTLLVDNGSLEPAATLRLRELAAGLSRRIGETVHPVSVLHSDKVDPALLDGMPAETFEAHARAARLSGVTELRVIPLFFGPSLALTEFLPQLASKAGVHLGIGPTLGSPSRHARLIHLLGDNLRATGWTRGSGTVLLCDHGSPLAAVTAIRESLAAGLRESLGLRADELVGCAMERRPGAEYAFNEPMLADAIGRATGQVVVLMLFVLPGRHAGPAGDVATICATQAPAGVSWRLSPLVGEHAGLVELLAGS